MVKEANADSASYSQAIDFGTIRIDNPRNGASIVLGTNNSYGAKSNIATSSGSKSGIVNYTTQRLFIGPTINADTTATGTLTCSTTSTCSGCNIAFDSLTVSPTSQSFSARQTKPFYYGGKITIPADCGYGTFNTSITVRFEALLAGNPTASLPVTVVIEPQPVSVQSTQDLSFGAVLSTATHDVVVTPSGSRQSSAYVINDSSYHPANGVIKISKEEASSRSVSVAVDNSMVMNYGNTSLNVSLTTSPEASSITSLTQTDTYINVGGTLHVVQGAPAGEYIGTYNIVVTY